MERREFIALVSTAAGVGSSWAAEPGISSSASGAAVTVGEVIDRIRADIPAGPKDRTVDTLKIGRRDAIVRGIATSFMATGEVIERAVARGANLVISHEPTFYNHLDETDWLAGDPVFERKQRYLQELGVAVFRFHDFIHSLQPDPVLVGLMRDLGWYEYQISDTAVCEIPPLPLGDLARQVKSRLGVPSVRFVGNPSTICRRIGLEPGASGGQSQISAFRRAEIDCLVVGEISEWETNIYVGDAVWAGLSKGLIVMGHAASEETGMRLTVDWLKPRFPGIPVFHVPAGNSFTYVSA